MGPLELLAFAPLVMKFQTVSAFRAPEYKGALLRGGFGDFFRWLVCITRAPSCNDCPHLKSCSYSRVFETPVLREKSVVLRKYPYAPHPFVLTPPLNGGPLIPAGAEFQAEITLIGKGIESLAHIVAAFDAMGRSGRYGGAFRLIRVVSALPGSTVVYDGRTRRMEAEPPMWRPAGEIEPVQRVKLEFVTPLRLRTGGRYNARPDFVAVVHALLRRIHLLASVHGGGDGDVSWMRPLLAAADQAVTECSEFRLYRWSRMSGRQRREVPMDGVIGTLEASGELRPLIPYLYAGEWLHVGSGTSMGMGRYLIRRTG